MTSPINTVAVVGAGTMGQGIAQVIALTGRQVLLHDISSDQLDSAFKLIKKSLDKGVEKNKISSEAAEMAINNIGTTITLSSLKADFVIEAAIEDLKIKQDLFKKLEEINSPEAILSTNTSSIPVTQIGKHLIHKNRFLGLHFFNPAHIMPLVEVVATPATEERFVNQTFEFAKELGKSPVLAKDSPGFIVNRVARHFYVESLKILEDNVAGFEKIDKLLEASGFKMGPFRLMDLIGVDTNYKVTETMFNQFGKEPKFRPSRIQKQLVDAGLWGRKTGKGFYNYES